MKNLSASGNLLRKGETQAREDNPRSQGGRMSGRGAAVLAGLVGTFLWMASPAGGSHEPGGPARRFVRPDGDHARRRQPVNPAVPPHTAHFQSASLQQLGILTSTLSAEAADFPAISTVPGFTYRYDEKLQVFEPVTGSLGPIFVERPETVGKGSSSSVFRTRTSISSSSTGQISTSSTSRSPQRLLRRSEHAPTSRRSKTTPSP